MSTTPNVSNETLEAASREVAQDRRNWNPAHGAAFDHCRRMANVNYGGTVVFSAAERLVIENSDPNPYPIPSAGTASVEALAERNAYAAQGLGA